MDPKENVVSVGPKKGECYVCNADLASKPSIQIQKQIPIVRKMAAMGRVCLNCAVDLKHLVETRISQAHKGEYQA